MTCYLLGKVCTQERGEDRDVARGGLNRNDGGRFQVEHIIHI